MKQLEVIFICAGNTCRSPLAEAVARQRLGGLGVSVSSAGLQAVPGRPASEGSLLVGATMGLDLEGHRSRPLTANLLAKADWVIAMTGRQVEQLALRFPGHRAHVGLLGLPGVALERDPTVTGGEDVEDPYGQPLAAYHEMADRIVRFVTAWGEHFRARPTDAGHKREGGAGA